MSVRQKNLELIKAALGILKEQDSVIYTQAVICQKMDVLGFGVSTSLFNKLINNKRVGDSSLLKIKMGLTKLLELELGWYYDPVSETYIKREDKNWQREIIDVPDEASTAIKREPVFHFDGRRSTEEKVEFLQSAKREIIFLGIRLRQFVGFFSNRKDADFKDPILALLGRGVVIKCYLADPDSNLTRAYFTDRATVLPEDAFGDALIPQIIEDLKKIKAELAALCEGAQFEIYTYKHFPTAHFLSVDRSSFAGKMLVSNYTFGIPRSKIPVIEVNKEYNPKLFDMYNRSLEAIIKDAKEIL